MLLQVGTSIINISNVEEIQFDPDIEGQPRLTIRFLTFKPDFVAYGQVAAEAWICAVNIVNATPDHTIKLI